MSNKMDETFRTKRKKMDHNPQDESVRAVFGEPKAKGDEFTPKTFH